MHTEAMHTQVLVLGGGPGGYAAAFMAADLGLQVILVEAHASLGGTCLLRGCIPSKALLHVARVVSETREVADWGVHFDRPQLDLDAMRARKEKLIVTLSGGLAQLAKRRKVQRIEARGSFVDSQTLQLEGGDPATYENPRITFEHCIVATGSRPVVPEAFDLETDRVMDSTDALQLRDVPESLLVVGGGYIGLEMGTIYAELGSKVTVVELTDGLLPGVDRDLVKPLAKRLDQIMHAIHCSTKVVSLAVVRDQVAEDQINIAIEGPNGKDQIVADRVLVSIGRRPNTSRLGLENTQVELNDAGFIVVDRQQRTADPHILAVGDVVGEPMLAHKASHEGKIAAEILAGQSVEFAPAAIPAVVFTDPEIAWAGLTAEQAKREGRDVAVAQYPWQASGRAQAVGRTDGLTKWIIDPETDQLLGCGMVGAGAGELISEAVLAIEMGCTARDVADTIHPHPTLSETVAFAAETHLGFATEIYRPRRDRSKA